MVPNKVGMEAIQAEQSTSAPGRIVALHVAPARRAPMTSLAVAEVRADWGLVGDRHAKAGSRRQVLLVEAETLERLGLNPGAVRENVTVQGVALTALGAGSRLRLGDEVELEITQYCAPCRRLEEIRPGLIQEITGHRGMLARVIRGGHIRPGNSVKVVKAVPRQSRRLPG